MAADLMSDMLVGFNRRLWAALWVSLAIGPFGPVAAIAEDPSPAEIQLWETVKDSQDPAEIMAFLNAYPKGYYATLARMHLIMVARGEKAAKQSAETVHIFPTPDDYIIAAGGGLTLVRAGQLKIDGKKVSCGRAPTILDPKLPWRTASFVGFIVINPIKLQQARHVGQWLYAVACGYQSGSDVLAAECWAVRRGITERWLTPERVKDVCKFISEKDADTTKPPVAERCKYIKRCFKNPANP